MPAQPSPEGGARDLEKLRSACAAPGGAVRRLEELVAVDVTGSGAPPRKGWTKR
jgi:hypothetical protein